MRHRPAESDQLMIVIKECVLPLSQKLRDLGIQNFEELYKFEVQKESDLAQENKFFIGRSGANKELAPVVMCRLMLLGNLGGSVISKDLSLKFWRS